MRGQGRASHYRLAGFMLTTQAQRTPMAHPAVPEGQLQDMPSAAVPGVEGDCDDESTDLALQMTPSGTTCASCPSCNHLHAAVLTPSGCNNSSWLQI